MQISAEENELLKELIEQYDYPSFDPSRHVTAMMLGKQLGITDRTARYRLEKLRAEGSVDREKVRLDDGSVVYGYFSLD